MTTAQTKGCIGDLWCLWPKLSSTQRSIWTTTQCWYPLKIWERKSTMLWKSPKWKDTLRCYSQGIVCMAVFWLCDHLPLRWCERPCRLRHRRRWYRPPFSCSHYPFRIRHSLPLKAKPYLRMFSEEMPRASSSVSYCFSPICFRALAAVSSSVLSPS